MRFFRKSRKKAFCISLDKLVNDIRGMLNESQLNMERNQTERLKMFFEDDGLPKKIRCKTGANSIIEVPLIMLTSHQTMQLNEMKITLPIAAQSIDAEALNSEQENKEGSYSVTFSKREIDKGVFNVEILFRLKEDKI